MGYNYAYQGSMDNAARAVITNAPISTKTAVMIAQFVRNKPVSRAQKELSAVLEKTQAVPFTRFSEGAGHKRKIGPGKFPQKATQIFLDVIASAVANAQDQGLSENLVVTSIVAQEANGGYRYGRKRGQTRKSTHVEVVVSEVSQ